VELVRGRCAGGIGDLVSLLALVKGLALGYQRDLQEDKAPVWRSTWLAATGVQAMSAAIEGIVLNHSRLCTALSDDLLATEIADVLVAQGIPFREAHGLVANRAAQARTHGIGLRDVAEHPGCSLPQPITAQMLTGLSHEDAVERRDSIGGTARAAVERQITRAKVLLSVTHG
jgi:argininosuccinate lyase